MKVICIIITISVGSIQGKLLLVLDQLQGKLLLVLSQLQGSSELYQWMNAVVLLSLLTRLQGKKRSKHIKGSKEPLFIRTQTHNLQISGVIPFVKLQNDP